MIDLYYWPTPNGHKITMFLEEAELDYAIHPVDISAGDQFKPEFLAISPNNRMPAIVDLKPSDGGKPISVFESGAILSYLADKTRVLLPTDLRERTEVFEWVFWQVGGLGPMAGQNHHFGQYAPEKIPYAIERYVKETNRLYGVLDRRLAGREFIAADAYTIGDIAAYPGSCRGSASSRTSTRSRTYAAGSMRCAAAVPRSAPMPRASHFRVGPQSPRRGRSCCLARRRRRCR
jgi:GSH-dependent disulfide-bond oxidoreductase